MSSGLDVLSGSLRVRNGTFSKSKNYNNVKNCRIEEVKACPSVMSPETKRLLPPNTETVQTKPFPIRGTYAIILHFSRPIISFSIRQTALNVTSDT